MKLETFLGVLRPTANSVYRTLDLANGSGHGSWVMGQVAVNDCLANLTVSCPLSTYKPLWEMHILDAHKCFVIRFHHAVGDGVSLLSLLLLTMCRRVSDGEKIVTVETTSSSACLWVRDKDTVVRGGAGVELWPRKLATAKFTLDDMITVKSAVVNSGPNTYDQRRETIEVVERWIFQDL
ncbi:putative transferase [Helianthus annuus]|uniref:Transferase n=1 Tax=Helianthus annuus TaxID=4232 RepID=A0A9K3II64_HELAN|nr:putative transferase [Helianthus annuus]KAJ0540073.1 putative transferase [Helianthus annuus]KAJ0548482.1 putative transferase [Helianthus annuus]KAJ0554812.1 putative transferase [Helianthus annuus]KAJ0720379.1 putative transferase [Helianthus annuus]